MNEPSTHRKPGAPRLARGTLGGLLLLAAIAACTRPADDASARDEVRQVFDRYVEASNGGDADALAALYAEDALLLPPDQELVEGREAIREFWEDGTEPGLSASVERIEVRGDLAYLVGRYALPPTDTDAADVGKLVLCLRRDPAERAWRITCDIWNGSLTEPMEDVAPRGERRSVS